MIAVLRFRGARTATTSSARIQGASLARASIQGMDNRKLATNRDGLCETHSRRNGVDTQVTLAWLGHSTVLINFFGVTILTDPVLFPRVGIRLPGITIGPKRLTAPALRVS